MGQLEMAGKHKNPATQVGSRHRLRQPDPGASGGSSQGNFTGVYGGGGQNRLPRLKPGRPKNGSKRPSLVLTCFGSFSRVFGVQN